MRRLSNVFYTIYIWSFLFVHGHQIMKTDAFVNRGVQVHSYPFIIRKSSFLPSWKWVQELFESRWSKFQDLHDDNDYERNERMRGKEGSSVHHFFNPMSLSKKDVIMDSSWFRPSTSFESNTNLPSFDQWAGSPEIVEECRQIIRFLHNSTSFVSMGAKLPRGLLLEGPPGVGKTLLAQAMANESCRPFLYVSASQFVEMYVGIGSRRIRQLFETARRSAPCILFIDEIDAVGRRRSSGSVAHVNEEREQTLNQLLVEMDGFVTKEDTILVIAATNRRDILDPALTRSGRFDRCITLSLPDDSSRKLIWKKHISFRQCQWQNWTDEDWNHLGLLSEGYSGADIASIVNQASIIAVLKNCTYLQPSHVLDALTRHQLGIPLSIEDRPETMTERIALHELGHALAVERSQSYDIHQISLYPTSKGSGGSTWFLPHTNDSSLMTRDQCMERLVILLGGKAAEHVFYGGSGWSVGVLQDIQQARLWMEDMLYRLGLSTQVPHFSTSVEPSFFVCSDSRRKIFEEETQKWVNDAYDQIYTYLDTHKHQIRSFLLPKLLEKRHVEKEEWKQWIKEFHHHHQKTSSKD